MPYTMDDLVRETIDELVKTHLNEILQKVPVEKRFEGLSAEDLIRAIPPKTLEAFLRQIKEQGPPADSN